MGFYGMPKIDLKLILCPGWCGSVVECWSVNQRVTGLIPSLRHMPGLRARSSVGGSEKQPHIDVSFPLFLPPFPSLKNK